MTKVSCIVSVALAGCAGVYGEVSATKMSSATLASAPVSGAGAVSFNVGFDFGGIKQRFAIGYQSNTVSWDGASSSLGFSDMRYDHNLVALSHQLALRIGAGLDFGSSSDMIGGTKHTGNGGGVYAGLDLTYFLTWHIALHAFVGPQYLTEQVTGGSFESTGVTGRVALSYSFGDVRPNPSWIVPMDSSRDVTGLIAAGAQSAGCTDSRVSAPESGYADIHVRCPGGRNIEYFQIAQGVLISCDHTFEKECRALDNQVIGAAEKLITPKSTPAAAPAPASAPAAPSAPPAPAPAATPAPAPEAAPTSP